MKRQNKFNMKKTRKIKLYQIINKAMTRRRKCTIRAKIMKKNKGLNKIYKKKKKNRLKTKENNRKISPFNKRNLASSSSKISLSNNKLNLKRSRRIKND